MLTARCAPLLCRPVAARSTGRGRCSAVPGESARAPSLSTSSSPCGESESWACALGAGVGRGDLSPALRRPSGSCCITGSCSCGQDGKRRELTSRPCGIVSCPLASLLLITPHQGPMSYPPAVSGRGLVDLVCGDHWDVLHHCRVVQNCHDDAAKFVHLLMNPGCNYLVQEDFIPFLQVRPCVYTTRTFSPPPLLPGMPLRLHRMHLLPSSRSTCALTLHAPSPLLPGPPPRLHRTHLLPSSQVLPCIYTACTFSPPPRSAPVSTLHAGCQSGSLLSGFCFPKRWLRDQPLLCV